MSDLGFESYKAQLKKMNEQALKVEQVAMLYEIMNAIHKLRESLYTAIYNLEKKIK